MTAFFFKQWGGHTTNANGHELDGRTWDEFPRPHPSAAEPTPVKITGTKAKAMGITTTGAGAGEITAADIPPDYKDRLRSLVAEGERNDVDIAMLLIEIQGLTRWSYRTLADWCGQEGVSLGKSQIERLVKYGHSLQVLSPVGDKPLPAERTIRSLSRAISKGMPDDDARALWESVTGGEGPPTGATVDEAVKATPYGMAKAMADPIATVRRLTKAIEATTDWRTDDPEIVAELSRARDLINAEIYRRTDSTKTIDTTAKPVEAARAATIVEKPEKATKKGRRSPVRDQLEALMLSDFGNEWQEDVAIFHTNKRNYEQRGEKPPSWTGAINALNHLAWKDRVIEKQIRSPKRNSPNEVFQRPTTHYRARQAAEKATGAA